MAKFFVTYGTGTNLANCYSVIEADEYDQARQKAFEVTEGKFAFIYDEEQFFGQIEKWDLTEVELQPQRRNR